MRRKTYRIMAIMAAALLAFATGGCVDPLDDSLKPQPEEPTLTFWIRVPGSMLSTKAETGDVASISPESKIYDVQVWAFAHGAADTDLPLNYVDKDNISFENTTQKNWDDSYKIQMPLPKEFVLGTDPRVDFYILANWQSIFTTKPSQMTLADVRDLVFGAGTKTEAYFGTTTPTTAVPAKGLPISTIYMGEDGDDDDTEPDGVSLQFLQDAYNGTGEPLTNEVFRRELGVIELERAVAKIRFAFARTTGVTGVQITKIEIDGSLIPDNTYAFPNSRTNFYPGETPTFGGVTTLAGTGTAPLLNTAAIAEVALPDAMASTESTIAAATTGKIYTGKKPSEMTAQQYDTFLADSTTTQLVYFRESGKAITGKIYYRKTAADTEDTVVEFSMMQENNTLEFPDKTNLHRNHYWTVYAYFLGNGLYIKPVVLPWEDGTSYTYTQRGSAVVAISQKKETLFGYGWTTAHGNPWYQNRVVSIRTQYNSSADNTMGEWSDSAPTDYSTNKYFWTRSAITLQSDPEDPHTIYSIPVAKSPKGDEGTAPFVSSISVQYALGESSAAAPSTGWSDTAPTWINDNTFIWSRTTTTYTDNTTQINDVCLFRNTEWYFRRQEEGNSDWAYDWLHSQMVSAPGLNAGGAPIYANRIELRTNNFNVPLRLKLSNPTDFYLVTYNAASANYVSWTEADGALIPLEITGSVLGGTTYFYVVPKDGADHEGKTTEAYLVTAPTDGTGGQKIPFNAGVFPGSNENTEINFYSVSVGKFKSYYDADARQNDNIKPYDKSGEVTI